MEDCCETKPKKEIIHSEHEGHDHDHDHAHDSGDQTIFQLFLPAILSFALLLLGIFLDYILKPDWFSGWIRLTLYLIAYIPVGIPVLKEAWKSIIHGDVFSEFFLMGIATVGAFSIGEYPEGVAVMLFYSVGEVFQAMAVTKA